MSLCLHFDQDMFEYAHSKWIMEITLIIFLLGTLFRIDRGFLALLR